MKFKSILACSLALTISAVTVNAGTPQGAAPEMKTASVLTPAEFYGTITNAPGDVHYCSMCPPLECDDDLSVIDCLGLNVGDVCADATGLCQASFPNITHHFPTNLFAAPGSFGEVGDDYASGIAGIGDNIHIIRGGFCTDTSACSVAAQDCADLSPCIDGASGTGPDHYAWMSGVTVLGSPNVNCMDFFNSCGQFYNEVCFGLPGTGGTVDTIFTWDGPGGGVPFRMTASGYVNQWDASGFFGGNSIVWVGAVDTAGFTAGINDLSTMVIAPGIGPFGIDPANIGDHANPDPNLMPQSIQGSAVPGSDLLFPDFGGGPWFLPGACCLPGAVCSVISECDCILAGGNYGGDSTDCTGADTDGDGDLDVCDICINDPDNDIDGDTVCGDVDNCPDDANTLQVDSDSDGAGDACDVCPTDADDDIDGDGQCCTNDGITEDLCCTDGTKVAPGVCGCNIPDDDTDGDGVEDCDDLCPGVDDAVFGDCTGEIPTVSEWGLVVLALLLLVAGKVYFGRRTVLS